MLRYFSINLKIHSEWVWAKIIFFKPSTNKNLIFEAILVCFKVKMNSYSYHLLTKKLNCLILYLLSIPIKRVEVGITG